MRKLHLVFHKKANFNDKNEEETILKKIYVRFIAVVVTTMLIISTFPTLPSSIVIAAQVKYNNVNQDVKSTNKSTNNSQTSSGLKPFTSTEDLVAGMKAELLKKGVNTIDEEEEQRLEILSATIEKKSGYTLTEIKSLLAISIFQDREQNVVDVLEYNLSKDEMEEVINLVLEDYCATNTVKVSINVNENGIAQTITVDMNSGFKAGLDALDEINGVGEIYPATENIEEKEETTPTVESLDKITETFPKRAQIEGKPSTETSNPTGLDNTGAPDGTESPDGRETLYVEVIQDELGSQESGSQEPDTASCDEGTHIFGEPVFTWSEFNLLLEADNKMPYTCEAKFTCTKCKNEEESIKVECSVSKVEQQMRIEYRATCEFNGKEYSNERDATTEQLYAHWGKLCDFYGESSEYFGISAEYWTSKSTENNPFGALKVLAGYDIDTDIPAPNMDELIYGITQAFSAYVYWYGDALLAMREEALSCLDESMTDLQKCLVLHDYLATHAVFDMASLVKYQTGEGQNDPISMTPFSTLLYGKIEGLNGSVCLAYATTYTYLIQCAFPEIYRDESGAFKNYEEILESGNDMVDFVMIKYNCDVAVVGVTEGDGGFSGTFNEPHYYNVVKLDGEWYNVDVCYDDIKTETLTQYRVETDGNLSHMYFLVSQQTIEDWYKGYYDYIDTLHGINSEEPSSNQQYEDAWFSNINCPISYDDEYWYFVEAQFSELDMMDQDQGDMLAGMDSDQLADMMKDYGDQMKLRPRTAPDSSAEEGTIIFDYGKGTVTNPSGKETKEGLLEEDCNDDLQINNIYPDLTHSVSLYNNILYFNLNNKIYMYNLADGAVTQLKEYNTVHANSNGTPFTGSSYYITNAQDENLEFTIKNHPLAGLCIKQDGIMYVSVATNYSNSENSKYRIESVNFNPTYNRFADDNPDDANSNKEFMWCANVKDNIIMDDVENYLSSGTTVENVVVDPWCGKEGYTEGRDTAHGFSSGTQKSDITQPKEHHYIDNETEKCYICAHCYKMIDTEKVAEQGVKTGHTYSEDTKPVFSWDELEDGGYTCTATVACDECSDIQKLDTNVTSQSQDGTVIYTANCNFDQESYTATKIVEVSQPTVTVTPTVSPSTPTVSPPSGGGGGGGGPVYVPVIVNKPITKLEIMNGNIKLAKNSSIGLQLQITPSDATETGLQYTSSNATIATVSKEGIVTGKQVGTAMITVATQDGHVTAKATVEVGEPVTSIELNHKELYLLINESSLISATLLPNNAINKEVKYISQDASIATVDQMGKITAVSTGTTQIMVKAMDGSEVMATCLVTVQQKVVNLSITSIKTQTYTGKAVKPKVIIKEGDYTLYNGIDYTLKWKNNTKIGKASVTIVGKGNYTGTKTIYFVIKPAKAVLSSLKSSKATTGVVTWKSMQGVSGYQVYYKTSVKDSYKLAGTSKKTSFTISELKSKSTVYVKVRAYTVINGKKVYGNFSDMKKVKVK